MKIHGDEDEYAEVRAMLEADRIYREQERCKFIVGIIVLIVLGWIFADSIISALERDDYKGDRVTVVHKV